jgi:hypothetical protein
MGGASEQSKARSRRAQSFYEARPAMLWTGFLVSYVFFVISYVGQINTKDAPYQVPLCLLRQFVRIPWPFSGREVFRVKRVN